MALSVVMVGKNDDYGYMPLERAAHAINLWALELQDGDEIIFVDDNSDGDTLPEELDSRSMISEKALRMLRVIKVPRETHECFEVSTPVAEYQCKNIGIRHAKGEWVVCTNSDVFPIGMLRPEKFLPQHLYVISTVKHIPVIDWIEAKDLDDIIYIAKEIRERGIWKPGDFQLAHKNLWIGLKGYDEDLVDWGYNDSLLVQKAGKAGVIDAAGTGLNVYHLNHKTANHPARGWDFEKSVQRDPMLRQRSISTNGEEWGTWAVKEISLCSR